MKKTLQLATVSVLAFALTQYAEAVPINGNIGFTGGVVFNTGSASTATSVTKWIDPVAKLSSGTFASVASGTAATFATPWSFNSGPVAAFWSVGGFTFDLVASSITKQGGTSSGLGGYGYVVVSGTGTVSGNGFDATPMIWNFSSQDPKAGTNPDRWTFSASAESTGSVKPPSVADSGSTVMLLGSALLGVAWINRKFVVSF